MKKLIGTLAVMAALGLAAGAQAGGQEEDIGGSGSGSMGGTGSMGGKTGTMGQQQQLEGKVLKAEKNTITIEHMGAAVPLQVQSNTSFQGVKGAKDIKEGSQVRASFSVKGAKNEATSIEVLPPSQGGTGMEGGTGSEGSAPPSGSEPPSGGY